MQTLTCSVIQDDITKECSTAFDFQFNGTITTSVPSIDIPDSYQIGLIVGPSGSGKSTILSQIGEMKRIEWDNSKAICSCFSNAKEAKSRLAAVGLNSIPSWLKPFNILSNGERFRADLARRIESGAVIDEFTSVVDRKVASSCAYSIQRYIRAENLQQITFATCHYDVIEWLSPDWVFDTKTERMLGRGSVRRPKIVVELLPCSTTAWSIFSKHHYLDKNINKSSRCWLAMWDGEMIGFTSILAFPNGALKNAWRGHRTVVLPEFQGLGLGVRISDAVGEIVLANKGRYFSKTASDRMGGYRESSAAWTPTTKNKKARHDYKLERTTKEDKHKMAHVNRVCFSHEYIGLPERQTPYEG